MYLYDLGEEENLKMVLGKKSFGRWTFFSLLIWMLFPYLQEDSNYVQLVHKNFKVDFVVN